jgi:alpha-mannosidase
MDDKTELNILHSIPEDYFKELNKDNLNEVAKGLNPVAQGCYTSQIRVKQKHRLLENEYYTAEKMAVAAEIKYGRPYPVLNFMEARKALLFSEFHDALPGSGSPYVEEDTLRVLDHGLEIISREKHYAALSLASREERVKEGSSTIMFYNPHPYDITGVFTCEVGLPQQNWSTKFMYPEVMFEGKKIPTQAEKECSNFSIDWRKKVVIQATLKASSMNRMDVYFKPLEKRPVFEEIASKPRYIFDNGRMKVVINTGTGLLEEYSVDGKSYLAENSFQLTAFDDTNNPWGIRTKSTGKRSFQLLMPHEGSEFCGLKSKVIPSVRIIEDGEVRTTIEAVFGMHNSKAFIRYQLPKTGTDFDIELGVLFLEKEQYLKLMLNMPQKENDFSGQIIFARELLEQNEETVSQKWVMVSSKDHENAVAVINKGTHGASYSDGRLGITLLRSAGYTASDFVMGKALQEEQWAPRMDQGERFYQFRITAGNEKDLGNHLDQIAQAYNEEPYGMAYCPPGYDNTKNDCKADRLITIDNPEVILSAMKKCEDRDGYLIRLYESTGENTETNFVLLEGLIKSTIAFRANEIKTFYLSIKERTLEETDLIELRQ